MIKLYSPQNEGELALLRSILEAAEVPYFVHNDHFGSMEVGPRIDLVNVKTIMVPEEFQEQAEELVADYLGATSPAPRNRSRADTIRMILEVLLFQWLVPGKRTHRAERDDQPE